MCKKAALLALILPVRPSSPRARFRRRRKLPPATGQQVVLIQEGVAK